MRKARPWSWTGPAHLDAPVGEIGTIERFRGEASLALYLGMATLDRSSGKYRGSKAPKHVDARGAPRRARSGAGVGGRLHGLGEDRVNGGPGALDLGREVVLQALAQGPDERRGDRGF